MEIMTDQQLVEQIEAFLEKNEMPPSRFGVEAMGDPALVFQLRGEGKYEGKPRSLSLRNAARVLRFMADYRPESAAA